MNIEDEILEFLRGESGKDHFQLLREARAEIIYLKDRVSDLGWAVEYHRDLADRFESQLSW